MTAVPGSNNKMTAVPRPKIKSTAVPGPKVRKVLRKPQAQQQLPFHTWGGIRRGAGRKPRLGKAGIAHRARPLHDRQHPLHVTLRVRRGLPSLRTQTVFFAIRGALGKASRAAFRIVHFSVQIDHVHLIIEAKDKAALSSGAAGLSIRVARAANWALRRRGRFWSDRYHARPLRSPREVRNAVVYVITNWRKHVQRSSGLDPCSSAWWFTGWSVPPRGPPSPGWTEDEPVPVRLARTWLGRVGWRKRGLVRLDERPRSS